MPQNRLLASAVLALLPLQLIGEAQAQAPAAPAAAGGARSGGRGLGDSRGLGDQFLRSPSDQLKLTERFTRIDPEMIDYRIRVEDLATWTAPCTVRFTITQQPKYQLNEYSCHEGNGAVIRFEKSAAGNRNKEHALRVINHRCPTILTTPIAVPNAAPPRR